jgi:hypothetical protein
MYKTAKEIYAAGILFFYYVKWPVLIFYPVLVKGMDYPRFWLLDILWIYSAFLALKDIIYRFVLKRSYCDREES